MQHQKAEITKAADSDFEPGYPEGTDEDYSYLGKFMVAKVHGIATMMGTIEDDWSPCDYTSYAVLPENFEKETVYVGRSGQLETFFVSISDVSCFHGTCTGGTIYRGTGSGSHSNTKEF